jgi:amidase
VRRAFFAEYDLLLCPAATTVAFEQVTGVPRAEQRFIVDGAPRLATDTYYWLGLAALSYLPSTTVPVGFTRAGLPVGMQVIGPEFGDYRCIAFAEFLEQGFRGYAPPPGFE